MSKKTSNPTEDMFSLLKNHTLWVATDGAQGERADLRDAHLAGRSLWRVDLRRALLDGCDLAAANLDHADFRGASLKGARLSSASLWEANLAKADLRDADLRGAKLDHADLSGADISGASLEGASLKFVRLDQPT